MNFRPLLEPIRIFSKEKIKVIKIKIMFFVSFISYFIFRFSNIFNLRLLFKIFIKRFSNIFTIILIFFAFRFRLFIFILFAIIIIGLFNILISFIYITNKSKSKNIFFNFYKLKKFNYNLFYNFTKILYNILEKI